jgi:hypothetical protein
MKVLMQDPDSLVERLTRDSYAQPALVPASPWLDSIAPGRPAVQPRLDAASGEMVIDMDPASGDKEPWLWVVQARTSSGWTTQIIPGTEATHFLAGRGDKSPREVWVYAVGRTGNLSPPARVFPNGDPIPELGSGGS